MHTVNHCSCGRVRQSAACVVLICVAIGALALPARAQAQFIGSATATGQFESNSNLFAFDNGATQPGTSGARGSSNDFVYGASLDGAYTWSRQELYATATVKEFDYQQYSDLNHNEYDLDGGLKWQLAELLDGNVEVTRTHAMVPFLDLSGTQEALSLLTVQQESFQVGLKLSSEWKLEGSAVTSTTNQPIAGASNQELTQTSGTTSIEYAGFGPFTSGLTGSYLTGDYNGLNGAQDSSFSQSTVGFLTNYKFSRTTFNGQVTYTHRTSDDSRDNASGLTGLVSFKDQLTAKTSVVLTLDRAINTYYLNLGSEIDSEAGITVDWQATYKIGTSLGYTFTYRAFPGQAQGPSNAYPVDYQQYVTLAVTYKPVRWLSIAPYANVQTRRSNVFGNNFNATVYGVTLSAKVGEDRPK
jgi:hypothetical protein